MLMHAYSVKDLAAQAFLPLFFVRARGEALRSFVSACENSEHQFAKNLPDYELYYCGTFDDHTGHMIPNGMDGPELIMRAVDAVPKKN